MGNHLQPGTLLQNGKYRIVRFIKSGGFGCTYEAENTYFKERVALKEFFVRDFCNRDEDNLSVSIGTKSKIELVGKLKAKFMEEAVALYKLRHPGIVHVSDIFEENNTAYYVMDYIDGCSLDVYIKERGALSEAVTLNYTHQVCDALKYVHSQNRLHLDLKPGNIMLTKSYDRVILIDFGTAKQYDECSGENTSTLLGCTPGYSPLEQAYSKITQFYPATDIYALGATMYKLLTGVTPLPATGRGSGEELDPLPLTVSQSTRNAIEHAMELSKLKRPQSVDEFILLLDAPVKQEEEEPMTEMPYDEDDDATLLLGSEPAPAPSHEVTTENKQKSSSLSRPTSAPAPRPIPRPVPTSPTAPRPVPTSASAPTPATTHAPRPIPVQKPASASSSEQVPASLPLYSKRISNHSPWWLTKLVGSNEISIPSEYHMNHGCVELGLSVKWASCNIGAVQPSNFGEYFVWDEAENALSTWGGNWRLPTVEDLKELIEGCVWTWTKQGGKYGYKVTGLNGNSIFLPYAGWCTGARNFNYPSFYWASTPNMNSSDKAHSFSFDSNRLEVVLFSRYNGCSIRPVLD